MGVSHSHEENKSEEKYATPHLTLQEQSLVTRLMEEYPKLDQLMAETIVWDYFRKQQTEENTECNEATPGSPSEKTKSPRATSGPSSASAPTPHASKPSDVLEGSTTSVATPPPATEA